MPDDKAEDEKASRERLPGRLERTLKTAWLGGALGVRHAAGKLTDLARPDDARAASGASRRVASTKQAVATMHELRGPLMKVGQLFSTHTHLLSPELRALLEPLQAKAPPMPFAAIRTVVERELGGPLEAHFASFDREAVAAASLGQVHRARLLDGTEVAVKVQYPGAAESVAGDARNLAAAAALSKTLLADVLRQGKLDLSPMAAELAEHLTQETDYCREAYNAKLLARLFAEYPAADVVIPKVFDTHSGLRVITYEWLEGEPLDAALLSADPAVRARVVSQLAHSFWHQVHRGGVMHADPHPGNYRVLPDGRLGLLDFGCVKVFEDGFLREFHRMARARFLGDEDAVRDAMVSLELIDHAGDTRGYEEMLRLSRFMSVGIDQDADFDFGAFDYGREGAALLRFFLERRTLPKAHREFLFLTRVVLGHYEYFSRAKAKRNFYRMVAPYLAEPWAGRAVAVPPYG